MSSVTFLSQDMAAPSYQSLGCTRGSLVLSICLEAPEMAHWSFHPIWFGCWVHPLEFKCWKHRILKFMLMDLEAEALGDGWKYVIWFYTIRKTWVDTPALSPHVTPLAVSDSARRPSWDASTLQNYEWSWCLPITWAGIFCYSNSN